MTHAGSGLTALVLGLAIFASPAATLARQRPAPTQAEVEALEERADALIKERKLDDAVKVIEQVIALRERLAGRDDLDVAAALNWLGVVHFQRGDVASAEVPLSRALAIRQAKLPAGDPEVAQALNNMASVHQQLGRFGEAEPLMLKALEMQRASGAKPADLAVAHNNVGGMYTEWGDFARARDHHTRALQLRREALPPDDPAVAASLNNIGYVLLEEGDLAGAEPLLRQALAIRDKTENAALANTLNNLGRALQEQGDLEGAEPMFTRAVRVYEKTLPPTHHLLGTAVNNLAVLYLLRGDLERAGPLYTRALEIREKALGPHHIDVATSLAAYAVYLWQAGKKPDAIRAQARSADITERNLSRVLDAGSETQKERYLQLFADANDITLWMRSGLASDADANRIAQLAVLRRKGRLQEILAASADALRGAASPAQRKELDRLIAAKSALARLVLSTPGGAAAQDREARIAALQEEIDGLERRLNVPVGAAREKDAWTAERLQALIPEGTALVEFFRYRPFDPAATRRNARFGAPRYVAYASRAGAATEWRELGDAQRIDDAVAGLREALMNPRRSDVPDRGRDVWPLVGQPLVELAGGAAHVILSPDADLNLLPFAALIDDRGEYLGRRVLLTYVNSARELAPAPAQARPGPALIVSNPAFGAAAARAFEPLAGADAEARALASMIEGAQWLRGARATEGALKRAARPAILHVATHGFFLREGDAALAAGTRGLKTVGAGSAIDIPPLLRSGLALAGANQGGRDGEDGILTAGEAAHLDLRGTELVFLSACETGLGVVNAGESVYGLRRAFAIAGARSQAITLWQVSDDATRQFVVAFYRALLGGASRGEALRRAQTEAIADPARAHPFYWAAFIVSGDTGPLGRRQ